MRKPLTIAVGSAAVLSLVAPTALADNSAISIGRLGRLSATGQTAYIQATVICSEDTEDGFISARLRQIGPNGGVQTGRASVLAFNAVECSGEEETFWLAVRRPSGGFRWTRGTASVRNFVFETSDPDGTFTSRLRSRTITLR